MGYPGFRHGPSERLPVRHAEGFSTGPAEGRHPVLHPAFPHVLVLLPVHLPTAHHALLAEEEKTGTLESLLTTPIKTWQVVLGKYFSAYAFYIILWLPMLLYPLLADWSNLIVQWIYGYDAGMVLPYRLADWAGAYAILLLIGAWFTAIGIFASSMTGSQIISGIITIGLLVLIFFMGLIPVVWGEFPAAGIFHYMSCSEHLDRFSAGLVDTRPVIFYLTMTVLTLAVTIRIIDHRRWKH